jgi:hypothetical protein
MRVSSDDLFLALTLVLLAFIMLANVLSAGERIIR